MELRLTYNGPLYSPGDQWLNPERTKRRNVHKHQLRLHFHQQLFEFFNVHQTLNLLVSYKPEGGKIAPDSDGKDSAYIFLANRHTVTHGDGVQKYRFVPIVREEMSVLCSLHIVYLRRAKPGTIVSNSDIDNRLKTIIDALTVPKSQQLPDEPVSGDDEPDPVVVLLEDDRLLTHISVETDWLLGPLDPTKPDERDYDSDARVMITVKVSPFSYRVGILTGNML